ncbi:glycoside hydrolase family 43 protein [Salipaludibacillus agaradhaerens]|uniref:glycoside hydrolase family 43 protein n=1 Tax=Salipaludibacillus agaradhaerens TaxID=76935 RepID=UPI0021516C87|nr:glycoside hydrolase family 43 protein [Salipaludibacillus agaradhaerens]MCR6107745.1 glycoside hydrolase family 43 protein [Salipaludibacillus agaradhaerens]MCR6119774.1 glycoside hydrolase family 43 protein [Salipaludibacillus agaradhaerens]UJW58832.1 glycoside hydrolase family 43 protein [Bacillus sp. A116_S68]
MTTYRNPVLPGFYPDPSICRVQDDYYLVTSSFNYYPGVPIFHSKDLVNWCQIGHVLDRPSQLNLDGTPCSRGIYAPTLRYHAGTFYMITTFVVSQTGARKNFYVTATDPAGPWSDPYWLTDAPGIDPSLFFDDDGKVYYTGNRRPPTGQDYPKHMEIWLQEVDLQKGDLIGEKMSLWDGAMKQNHAQEAPHLYKLFSYYYLMIAEGGTGFTHSVTMARSKNITGPYEVCKTNPILTHRHLGRDYPITNIGHADIVDTQKGDWWMVCLGTRPYGGSHRNLGRETFLVPFVWEDNWPVVNPGKGIVELEMPFPNLEQKRCHVAPVCDHFNKNELSYQWNFIRTPRGDFWSLEERPGFLRLKAKGDVITDEVNPAFIGRRQQHINFMARTIMAYTPEKVGEEAGVVLLQNTDYQIRLTKLLVGGMPYLQLVRREAGEDTVLAIELAPAHMTYIKVEAYGQQYHFYYADKEEEWSTLGDVVDGRVLSSDLAGGFVGAYLGMYITGENRNTADFDWFEYVGLDN